MTSTPACPGPPRLYFIDNLRWLMIVLVVAIHASVTYSNIGSWYYNEKSDLDKPSLLLFVTFEVFTQAYFMGFLFLIAGPLGWAALLVVGGVVSGDFSRCVGGGTWESTAFSFWESFFCVGVCVGLLVIFRERFNRQGPFIKFLSDNAFAVYAFHAPILIALSLALREFHAHPLVKCAVLSALSLPATFIASHFVLRRIPLLNRVL